MCPMGMEYGTIEPTTKEKQTPEENPHTHKFDGAPHERRRETGRTAQGGFENGRGKHGQSEREPDRQSSN